MLYNYPFACLFLSRHGTNHLEARKHRPSSGQTIFKQKSIVPSQDRVFSDKKALSRDGTEHFRINKHRPMTGQSIFGRECIVPSRDGTFTRAEKYFNSKAGIFMQLNVLLKQIDYLQEEVNG